ncbi:MAG TPA: hypothetical protein VFV33_10320 [Gemmatimonadaceae bacterium]|nr:hypothetical protein [Gemmatimonadaceae bacterium]
MPDAAARLAFRATSTGRWRGRDVSGVVTLFVERDEVAVRHEASGEEWGAPLHALTGVSWRAGWLALHLPEEVLHLSEGEGLDRAWHALSLRACTLPEVARALRSFGRASGDAGRQAIDRERFFAPLLQARRRLESEEPVEWRVAGFDADALAERLRATLVALALERHADRAPHRRALEAVLLDACEPLFGHLGHLQAAANAVHAADDAVRFVAWRAWAGELRALFSHADRAWRAVADVLATADDRLPPTAPR